MLLNLSVNNYALIEKQNINFVEGFSTITGETGAGKSIMLGALGLILGERAEAKSVLHADKKCIVEAVFSIKKYGLKAFFEKEDLDYEEETIIRREILPSGKSRAFINDTPVLLQTLQKIGEQLIDIHSQYQTANLLTAEYQLAILDAVANHPEEIKKFQKDYVLYKQWNKKLEQVKKEQLEAEESRDYNQFIFEELENLAFVLGEEEELEQELKVLSSAEEIKQQLGLSLDLIDSEDFGISLKLNELVGNLAQIEEVSSELSSFYERVKSIKIDLDDVVGDLEDFQEGVEYNPERINEINQRLQAIYFLEQKHQVKGVKALIELKEELEAKLDLAFNASEIILELETKIEKLKLKLEKQATKISNNRKKAAKKSSQELLETLSELGMPKAKLEIEFKRSEDFNSLGYDQIEFLFTANAGGQLLSLSKAASGGERSRLMLAIKAMLAAYQNLPTIIFDEIDTGVSGNIAHKMAIIMHKLGHKMQVMAITHLPQVAAKGSVQFKVYKVEEKEQTFSKIIILNQEDRLIELAKMISGDDISEAALSQAKELLKTI